MRPLSMIAIRSCTHSRGLPEATWGSRKPAQPASRGLAANSSDRVGLGGAGNDQRAPSPGTPGGDPGVCFTGKRAGKLRVGLSEPQLARCDVVVAERDLAIGVFHLLTRKREIRHSLRIIWSAELLGDTHCRARVS